MGGTADLYHRWPRSEALRRSAALQLQNGALQHFSAAAPQSLASDDAPRERNAVRRPHFAIRRRPACESGRPAPAQILSDPLAQCEQMHGEAAYCHARAKCTIELRSSGFSVHRRSLSLGPYAPPRSSHPLIGQIPSDPLAQCEQMHGEAAYCHLRQGAGEVHDRAAHHGVLRASAFALPGSCWSRAAVCSVNGSCSWLRPPLFLVCLRNSQAIT
jgi:hypothetical protein